jgi:hypothetical protein
VNVTISGNSAKNADGGLYNFSGTTSLTNTIVAGNSADSSPSDIVVNSGSVSGSHDLVGTGGSGGLQNGVNGNIVGVADPGLAPLGNYGGPTQTMALLPGSPAINAGKTGANIPTTDQRGEPRVGAPDIGAFESQGFNSTDTQVTPAATRILVEASSVKASAATDPKQVVHRSSGGPAAVFADLVDQVLGSLADDMTAGSRVDQVALNRMGAHRNLPLGG